MEFTLTDRLIGEFQAGVLQVSPDAEKGYRPLETFVSSMAGCSGHVLKKILDKKRLEYKDITIEAAAERDADRANRISSLELTFTIHDLSREMTDSQFSQISKLVLSNCGMLQTISDSVDVTLLTKAG
ncbi:OsmC family protein [Falsibacillus pallidus]|uniref:OsmC family protein n=1 Tax=Falsibacillus pallidus TaxID=493781 RepID=UPI003D99C28D